MCPVGGGRGVYGAYVRKSGEDQTAPASYPPQKLSGNAVKHTDFLQARHDAHEAKQDRQRSEIDIARIVPIRRNRLFQFEEEFVYKGDVYYVSENQEEDIGIF